MTTDAECERATCRLARKRRAPEPPKTWKMMENSKLRRLISEWKGKLLKGWEAGDFINCGKSALVFKTSKASQEGAIKIFDPELVERFGGAEEAERIERELKLIGKEHPHLVRILDGGHSEKEDLYFVVMEYVDAPNLASVLNDLPGTQIRPLISQVAEAARFLETLDLVHRDIKPDNIAVSQDFNCAKLLDLGIMRPNEGDKSPPLTDREEQAFIGTAQYASPEFLLRKEEHSVEGYRALTFYQLGAVLYDMLEHRRIFSESASPSARLVQAVLHDIPKIDPVGKPADLVNLANNCLVKDPTLRLRIVKWEDFEATPRVLDSTATAKENIRKRRTRARHDAQPSESNSEYEESRRRAQVSGEILSRIAEQLRAASDQNELPPRTVKEFALDENQESHLVMCFKPSARSGLSVYFFLSVRLKLLDVSAQVVRIEATAAASAHELAGDLAASHFSHVFNGVYEDSVVRPALERALFPAFEKAMDLKDPVETVPIPLPGGVQPHE